MGINYTQSKRFTAGSPKSGMLKVNRKRFSSNLSDNYKLMLQLYCINKQQTAFRKEIKYEVKILSKSTDPVPKPSYSALARLVPFFTADFSLIKKVKQGIALVTG